MHHSTVSGLGSACFDSTACFDLTDGHGVSNLASCASLCFCTRDNGELVLVLRSGGSSSSTFLHWTICARSRIFYVGRRHEHTDRGYFQLTGTGIGGPTSPDWLSGLDSDCTAPPDQICDSGGSCQVLYIRCIEREACWPGSPPSSIRLGLDGVGRRMRAGCNRLLLAGPGVLFRPIRPMTLFEDVAWGRWESFGYTRI